MIIKKNNYGLTLIEVLVSIAIIAVLMSITIPALSGFMAKGYLAEDQSKIKGIFNALNGFSGQNSGAYPLPSNAVGENRKSNWSQVDGMTENPEELNTSKNLWSLLIAQSFLSPKDLISPVENNFNIKTFGERQKTNGDYESYDFSTLNDPNVLPWDQGFFAGASNERAHSSYAHLILQGTRLNRCWNSTSDSSILLAGNRAPLYGGMVRDGANSTPDFNGENWKCSKTLKFHGDENLWQGNVVAGDGSINLIPSLPYSDNLSYFPPGRRRNGGPDNPYADDFTVEFGKTFNDSGDIWLGVYDSFLIENQELRPNVDQENSADLDCE